MYIKTQAIVISKIKYRDSDLIVKCYTKSSGSISFMIKGVLKSKRGKFKAALFQTFNLIDIEMLYRNKGQLEYFKEVRPSVHLNNIQNNVYKSSLALFLSEVLKSVIQEEEQNEALFNFLYQSIMYLEQTLHFANFNISFLTKLSAYLGFYPQSVQDESKLFFNLNEGIFETKESAFSMNRYHSQLFKDFIELDLKDSQSILLSKIERQNMLKLLMSYYELHVESFQKPKSIEVIESIFN